MLKGIKLDQFTAVQAIWGPAFMLAAEFCWIFRCSVHLDLLSAVVFCKIHCSRQSATSGFHLPDIPLRPANICRLEEVADFSLPAISNVCSAFLFSISKSGTLNYAFWIFDRNVFLRKKSILSFPRCGKLLPQYLPCCWLGYRLNIQISWYLQTLHIARIFFSAWIFVSTTRLYLYKLDPSSQLLVCWDLLCHVSWDLAQSIFIKIIIHCNRQ